MTTFDRNTFDELLEAYLDGDLSPEAARNLEAFAKADAEAREELRVARLVQQRLHLLQQPACPPGVTKAVLAAARADARKSFVARLRAAAMSSWSTVVRPSLAMGAFVAIVIVGALIGRPADRPVGPTASETATPEEVEQALNDAKWALAYISNVGRRTATTIRDDVLDQHLVQPVNRALNVAFDEESQIQ